MLRTTRIAGTELDATRIGLGTWAIGGWMWGGNDEADSIAAVRAAVDRGITLIDTAPVYGMGTAEERVGRALAEGDRRDKVVLATKAGLNWTGRQPYRDAGPVRIRAEIDESRRRLRTEVIDVYQVHWPDPTVPVEDTARTLRELYEAGTIRAIGVSNFSPEQMDRFRTEAPLHVVQPPYNIFERGVEADVLPHAARHGLTSLTYSALCRGLLTGKLRPDSRFEGDDLRKVDPKFREPRYSQYLAAVTALDALARERFGTDVLRLAAAWLLHKPGVSVALWGARRPDQLDPVPEIGALQLTDDDVAEMERLVATHVADPIGPEFMAPPTRETV